MSADRPPLSVRWLWQLRDQIRVAGPRLFLIATAIGLLALLSTGIATIESGDTGVRLRFGKMIRDDLTPGLTLSLPRPIDRLIQLDTGEVQRLSVETSSDRLLELVTGDENLIRMRLTLQYRISSPGRFLFRSEDAMAVVEQVVRAEIIRSVVSLGVDDLLTSAKSLVQQQVRARGQDRLNELGTGVTLVSVNLQSVDPPWEAAEAFREVVDARARSAENVSRTTTAEEQTLALARAEANQLISSAEVEATTREQSARSAAEHFGALLARHRAAPEQTRTDLLEEARGSYLSEPTLIVLRPGESPQIDLLLDSKGSP